MKELFKTTVSTYLSAVTITLGIATAMGVWANGFGDWIAGGTIKVFKPKS